MKGKNSIHFSSGNDCWGTPQDLFDELNLEFDFKLDVCALPETAKCHDYCIPPVGAEYHILWPGQVWQDGLLQPWRAWGTCWMNPPYSDIKTWLGKARAESLLGATVVCLFPSRTDTAAWHDYVWDGVNHRPRTGVEVRFIRGRLKFTGAKDPAPFPSVVVIFRNPYKA